MAVFTIAEGQTLRMDKLVGMGSAQFPQLMGLPDGLVEYRWTNAQSAITYQIISTEVIFTPPFSDPVDDRQVVNHPLGDITLDLVFYDPAFGTGPIGTLTGTTWTDVTLVEYIQYVNVGGPDPLQPNDYYYLLDFEEPVLFGGDDIVTLGAGHDVFHDYGGNLEASLGGGDDVAWLYEDGQNVQDVKFVDAGDGNDEVNYQSGNGTILGGAGNDLIRDGGNSDGTWLFNGGSGRDTIYAYHESRIQDDVGSGSDTYYGTVSSYLFDVVLSYATGTGGIVVDLPNGSAFGGGHGVDTLIGIRAVEGTLGDDVMTGLRFVGSGVWGTRFWGMEGADTLQGGAASDLLDGGAGADSIIGWAGNDTILGGDGADDLAGRMGRDRITGGTGDDSITGGKGSDRLSGGEGADDFVFLGLADSRSLAAARDVIADFDAAEDQIDLQALGALTFTGSTPATARGQVWVEQSGGNTTIHVNLLGGPAADMSITLTGLHDLTGANFLL